MQVQAFDSSLLRLGLCDCLHHCDTITVCRQQTAMVVSTSLPCEHQMLLEQHAAVVQSSTPTQMKFQHRWICEAVISACLPACLYIVACLVGSWQCWLFTFDS